MKENQFLEQFVLAEETGGGDGSESGLMDDAVMDEATDHFVRSHAPLDHQHLATHDADLESNPLGCRGHGLLDLESMRE